MIFAWLDKRKRLAKVPGMVSEVARLAGDRAAFTQAAMKAARRMGMEAAGTLGKLLNKPGERPAEFDDVNLVAAASRWLTVWQGAILEILFQIGEEAIPVVRKAAFGKYDWPQAGAIVVLCQWAVVGLERERTMRDLCAKLPGMREDTVEMLAELLMMRVKADGRFEQVIGELRKIMKFEEKWVGATRNAKRMVEIRE